MAFYRRSAWTKASNAAVGLKRKQVHLTFHHPGFGNSAVKTAGWSLQRCFDQLRAWRNMHVGSGAYREVAYNLYALPTGDVAEGRLATRLTPRPPVGSDPHWSGPFSCPTSTGGLRDRHRPRDRSLYRPSPGRDRGRPPQPRRGGARCG